MSRPTRAHRAHRHLFWRMYLHNLGLLIAVAIFLTVFFRHFRHQSPWHRTPVAVAAQLSALPPAELPEAVSDVATLISANLAVYTRDGQRLAAGGAEIPAPIEPAAFDALTPGTGTFQARHLVAVVLDADRYLLLRWTGGDVTIFGWALAGLLILLGFLSWLASRALSRPIEHITRVADRLGGGDLAARVSPYPRHTPPDMVRLGDALDRMADRIERVREHERSLLAAVSHELRTPLARVRVALEWAAEEGDLPLPLDGVDGDLAELEELIADLLASGRLQTEGALPLHPATTALAELAESERARFAKLHPDRALTLTVADAELAVDARLLARVLANLLSNAARHADGPIALTGEHQPNAHGEPEYVFAVADRGPGLSEADRARVFDPFFRADASRARATGGVGMGLTLCKRIVEAHGGWIRAEANPGGGLVVRFGLAQPRVAADPDTSS